MIQKYTAQFQKLLSFKNKNKKIIEEFEQIEQELEETKNKAVLYYREQGIGEENELIKIMVSQVNKVWYDYDAVASIASENDLAILRQAKALEINKAAFEEAAKNNLIDIKLLTDSRREELQTPRVAISIKNDKK